MRGAFSEPAFVPCPECGVSFGDELHACDPGRRERYELFQVRLEAERFDRELTGWLRTPTGRFAIFYAERERRAATCSIG